MQKHPVRRFEKGLRKSALSCTLCPDISGVINNPTEVTALKSIEETIRRDEDMAKYVNRIPENPGVSSDLTSSSPRLLTAQCVISAVVHFSAFWGESGAPGSCF